MQTEEAFLLPACTAGAMYFPYEAVQLSVRFRTVYVIQSG